MKLVSFFLCLLCAAGGVVQAAPAQNSSQAAASRQIDAWQKKYNEYIKATVRSRKGGCTKDNIVYRQEWGSLPPQSRKDYVEAVKCLSSKPALSALSDVPGARSRFDDFQATHIIQAPSVHYTGLFFPFHRYFIWLYDKALREECGYTGRQPYWDFTQHWEDPSKSPVFDGSELSMGSNGQVVPHGIANLQAFGQTFKVPPGTGGGCIESGPLANYTVNLGPVASRPQGPDAGLGYNPRCLTRDLRPGFSNSTKPTDVTQLIANSTDLGSFYGDIDSPTGIHGAGHFTIGGLAQDGYASAGDPAFYLLHGQIDRLWTLWQFMDPAERMRQVYGTQTANNEPPSANVTLSTDIGFGVLAPKQPYDRLVSPIDGPFCYMYV